MDGQRANAGRAAGGEMKRQKEAGNTEERRQAGTRRCGGEAPAVVISRCQSGRQHTPANKGEAGQLETPSRATGGGGAREVRGKSDGERGEALTLTTHLQAGAGWMAARVCGRTWPVCGHDHSGRHVSRISRCALARPASRRAGGPRFRDAGTRRDMSSSPPAQSSPVQLASLSPGAGVKPGWLAGWLALSVVHLGRKSPAGHTGRAPRARSRASILRGAVNARQARETRADATHPPHFLIKYRPPAAAPAPSRRSASRLGIAGSASSAGPRAVYLCRPVISRHCRLHASPASTTTGLSLANSRPSVFFYPQAPSLSGGSRMPACPLA